MAAKPVKTQIKDKASPEVPGGSIEVSSPTGDKSLEELRSELETAKMSRAEREELLLKSLKKSLSAEAIASLTQMAESGEVTPENSELLKNVTAYLLALALYTEIKIDSVQDLITEYRSHKDESLRFLSQILIKIVAKNSSPLGSEFQSSIWDESKEEAASLVAAMHEVESLHKKEAEEEAEKAKEKNPDSSWYENHKNEVNTALILGGLGVGLYWLTNKLFKKENGESRASTGTKVALAGIVGAFGLGQVLGFESVQELISGGKTDSWVYKPWVKGLASAADLELGTAMDFWTGNGPTEAEQTMFAQMGSILGVSDTRLWGTSKLGFYEFIEGKNASLLPWHTDDEKTLRTKLKDYYLADLEDKLPYLKDKEKAKNISLRQVLVDGFKLGIIKDKDVTALSEADRAATAEREEADAKQAEEVRTYFDHPKENSDELKEIGENMLADIDKLDGSVDQYYDDVLVAFENMIGVDFDMGEDDSGEYRDLKEAREILYATFEEAGAVDHAFFEEKRGQVKNFLVFLEKHKDENPWSPATLEKYEEEYKSEMLILNQRIRASISRAELSNLQGMEKDRGSGEIIEDASEFVIVGVSGAIHKLNFRMEKLSEGNNFYIALTIAQGVGIASEFVDFDVIKGRYGLKPLGGVKHAIWKVAKGATFNLVAKPTVYTYKIGLGVYHLHQAYHYSAEGLLERWLKGDLAKKDLETRTALAEEYADYYKSRWRRITPGNVSDANLELKKFAELRKFLNSEGEFLAFVDGKTSIDGIRSDDAASMLKNLLDLDNHPEKLQEIRFYRAVKSLRESPHFNGLIEHLKDPTKPLSAEGRALFESLNANQQSCVKEMVKTEKGREILGYLTKTAVMEYVPQWLKKETISGEEVHTYQFGKEEYKIKNSEIATKAGLIADAERLAGRGPVPGEETAWDKSNWNKAIKSLCEERFSTPIAVSGKPGVYKMAGQEFTIEPAEVTAKQTALGVSEDAARRLICIEKGTAHLAIEEVRIGARGYEYKIGGEWIPSDDPSIPAKPDRVRAKFQEVIGKRERAFDFAKFASEAKTLKFFGILEKVLGTAGAVMVIYHLETAEDKRKAVCEVAAGFGTFMAGMKAADWKIGSKVSNPAWRLVIDLAGGFAAAYGFTEPISSLMEHFFESVPASYAVSKEVSDVFEKLSYRMITRTTLQSAEKGLVKKGVEKMGMHGLSRLFEKKISRVFLLKIERLAVKQGFKQVLKALGWKGVTTAALLADDATLIGVADDVIAAGLVVWMGFDIYEIITLIANAVEIEKQMAERQKHPIVSFNIKDETSRGEFQKLLTLHGLTIDRALELPEDAFFDILRTLPSVRVELKRENTLGSEVWTLSGGEATGIAVYDEHGEVECEINDEDAIKMEEALNEMEESDGGQEAA